MESDYGRELLIRDADCVFIECSYEAFSEDCYGCDYCEKGLKSAWGGWSYEDDEVEYVGTSHSDPNQSGSRKRLRLPAEILDDDGQMEALRKESAARGSRKGKRKVRGRRGVDPVLEFYCTLLGWDSGKELTRRALGLSALAPLASAYASADEYLASLRESVLEETRAAVADALSSVDRASESLSLELFRVDPCARLTHLHFRVRGCPLPLCAPGGLFLLSCSATRATVLAATSPLWGRCGDGQVVLAVHKRFCAETGTNSLLPHLLPDSRWKATYLECVVTLQRMFRACTEVRSPCLFRLLGQRIPTHSTFTEEGETVERTPQLSQTLPEISREQLPVLNESQWSAFRVCLASAHDSGQVRLVQGPPGCGKTHFASALLHQLVASGLRVLVCAPSNKALHVLIEKFLYEDASTPCALVGVDKFDSPLTNEIDMVEAFFQPNTLAAHIHVYSAADRMATLLRHVITKYLANPTSPWISIAIVRAFLVRLEKRMLEVTSNGSGEHFCMLLVNVRMALEEKDQRVAVASAALQMEDIAKGLRSMNLEASLLDRAGVVFSTLSSAGSGLMNRAGAFDVCLVDEAAQSMEAELLIPLSLEVKNLFLIGDPMQLPATVASAQLKASGRDKSTMQRLVANGYPYDLLNVQYRMHPQISAFSNRMFYRNGLINADTVPRKNFHAKDWLQHYAFIDCTGKEVRTRFAISNPEEADCIGGIIGRLRTLGLLRDASVSVITFYAAQVTYLRREMARMGEVSVAVNTVDSFQGSEADVVILSTVRCGSTVGFLKDFQRLNVALTRAKRLLLVVGDGKTLLNSGVDCLQELVMDAHARGRCFQSNAVLQRCVSKG